MNEYRVQRLKEELTYAQQRNKHQKKQLANYKNVHEKDLKETERLNNIINKAIEYLESYNTDFKHSRFNEAPISIRELGDLLDILKGSDK